MHIAWRRELCQSVLLGCGFEKIALADVVLFLQAKVGKVISFPLESYAAVRHPCQIACHALFQKFLVGLLQPVALFYGKEEIVCHIFCLAFPVKDIDAVPVNSDVLA